MILLFMDYRSESQKSVVKRAVCRSEGFTLVEMLISISVLMIFLALASGSYTSLVSANRRANSTQKLYHEVRNVFDTLASEVRGGSIDYSQNNILSILHGADNRSLFQYDKTKKRIVVIHQSHVKGIAGNIWASQESDWQSLTSEEFPVDDFSFTVFPAKNPYQAEHAKDDSSQVQPSVTLSLAMNGYEFRTTYSSRTYGKKNLYQAEPQRG